MSEPIDLLLVRHGEAEPAGKGSDLAPRHTLLARLWDVSHLPPELVLDG